MSSNVAPNIVKNGLILSIDAANQKSYDSGSSVWRDLTANLYTASILNGPTFNANNGGSLVYDGTNDYSETIIPVYSSFTLSIWIYPIAGGGILSYGNSGFFPILILSTNGVGLTVYVRDYYETYPSVLTFNRWNFVAISAYESPVSSRRVFVNGAFVGTNTYNIFTSQIGVVRFPVFGQLLSYGNFRVSNLMIHNRSLSDLEVLQNYNAQKSRFGL